MQRQEERDPAMELKVEGLKRRKRRIGRWVAEKALFDNQ